MMSRHAALGAGAAAALLALTGCAATDTGGGGGGSTKTLTYKVTGPTKKVSITYTAGGTKTTQDTEARVPWRKKIKTTDNAIVYQLNVQNMDMKSKKVKCQILDSNGKVLDQSVGKGQAAIAECQWNPNG